MKTTSIALILGPTGVGKSSIALDIAQTLNAEIISADSIQVYRRVEIGSAKASMADRSRVPHHLVDALDLNDPFDVTRFVELADRAISDISARGKNVLVVGGTNLYIRGLLHGIFDAPPADQALREHHKVYAQDNGIPALHLRLTQVDKIAASKIHENDLIRISRALEVFELTGKTISEHHKNHAFSEQRYRSQKVVIFRPRDELYHRINARVDLMIEEGIFEEYNALLESGFSKETKALNSIGYRHARMLSEGIDREEVLRLFKRDTRRFAKNQISWLKGESAWWFHLGESNIADLCTDLNIFFEGGSPEPTWLASPRFA